MLYRTLGVTYKTAWFMTHCIRDAMKPNEGGLLGSGGNTVEEDETFVGGKPSMKKRLGYAYKEVVFSLVEHNGDVRSFHIPDVTAATLKEKLKKQASKITRLMTDDCGQYRCVKEDYPKHEMVNHSLGEYVRGQLHTDTVEGSFSIFKRGIFGVYQHVSSPCVTEFDFRYNHRKVSDKKQADKAPRGIYGKRPYQLPR